MDGSTFPRLEARVDCAITTIQGSVLRRVWPDMPADVQARVMAALTAVEDQAGVSLLPQSAEPEQGRIALVWHEAPGVMLALTACPRPMLQLRQGGYDAEATFDPGTGDWQVFERIQPGLCGAGRPVPLDQAFQSLQQG